MSKASLLEFSHGEKKSQKILFPVPEGGNAYSKVYGSCKTSFR